MWGLFSLLADDDPTKGTMLEDAANGITVATNIVLGICIACVVFYAAYLGFVFAKAGEQQARDKAKSQLIHACIGVAAIVGVTLIMGVVIPAIATLTVDTEAIKMNDGKEVDISGISDVVTAAFHVLGGVATLFGLFLGWRIMSAEEEQKRNDAKKQLMYTCIGIVAVMVIMVIVPPVIAALA